MAGKSSSFKSALSALRNRSRLDEGEARRTTALYGTAGLVGFLERPREGETPEAREPLMDKLPDLGVPKTAILGIVGKFAANYMSGANADYLNGFADANAVIAIRDFTKGVQMSGVAGDSVSGRRRRGGADRSRLRALEAKLSNSLRDDGLDDVDAELADLEASGL
jgi:hypothetical protein